MPRRSALLALPFFLAACATPAPPPRPAPAVSPPRALPKRPARHLAILVASDKDEEGKVQVRVRIEGASAAEVARWTFEPRFGAVLDAVHAHDDAGELPVALAADGFTFGRAVAGAVEARYAVKLAPRPDLDGPFSEPIELRTNGEDVLALPELDPPIPFDLALRTGVSSVDAATTFGLGLDQHGTAREADLRRSYFIAGDVGTASFHTSYGDDVAGWLGHTAFDPRWVAAEAAAVRSGVDEYMGRQPSPTTPPTAFVFSSVKRAEPPVVVTPRTRGFFLSVDRRATWNAPARILLAESVAQRYLGGYLAIGDRRTPADGAFFAAGFSRAVGRDVLFESASIDPFERAAELNLLLAATTFADDPIELATARGALAATALDVALRRESGGRRSLRTFLVELLIAAEKERRDSLSLSELVARLRAASEARGRDFESELRGDKEIPLPADWLGRCWRLESKLLVPFELGFTTTSDDPLTVVRAKAGSNAAAAGLQPGDVVSELQYQPGRPRVPVTLVLSRGGEKKRNVRFLPAGKAKPGRVFERVPGIPDDKCGA
jgi:hypothetical protein